jgi:hypothetical protein
VQSHDGCSEMSYSFTVQSKSYAPRTEMVGVVAVVLDWLKVIIENQRSHCFRYVLVTHVDLRDLTKGQCTHLRMEVGVPFAFFAYTKLIRYRA